MKKFSFVLNIFLIFYMGQAYGSEAGMPQLNPEFWSAQVFWLILIFSSLYLVIWKIFLPKITYNIENRKSRVINDLDEAQKFKENAEKKLDEYNKIIEEAKRQAKKIVEDSKKKLDQDIEDKKKKLNEEIEKEVEAAEQEIKLLKKTSISNINKIAAITSEETIKKIINIEVNKSNVSAVVEDITKERVLKNI